ncbi:MAG: 5-oxoprolinase subunit PxpA [Pseudomonadota bacterium]
MVKKIDINCDIGENDAITADELALLDYVHSVNIACGFHAGNPAVMQQTVKNAADKNLSIGAHPGTLDRPNFGRKKVTLTGPEAYNLILYQIGALSAFLNVEGLTLTHVKPHGFLYNQAAVDAELAHYVAKAVYDFDSKLKLYALSGSQLAAAGEKCNLPTIHEAFADRRYLSADQLVPRSDDNAVITSTDAFIEQATKLIFDQQVISIHGEVIKLKVDTICIHSDTPNILDLVKALSESLKKQINY